MYESPIKYNIYEPYSAPHYFHVSVCRYIWFTNRLKVTNYAYTNYRARRASSVHLGYALLWCVWVTNYIRATNHVYTETHTMCMSRTMSESQTMSIWDIQGVTKYLRVTNHGYTNNRAHCWDIFTSPTLSDCAVERSMSHQLCHSHEPCACKL